MDITELYAPTISVQVGGYTFDQGVSIDICSSSDSYFDWAKVRFTPEFQPRILLARKDLAQISLGYEDDLEVVFSGFVSQPYSGGNANEIILKDQMLLLEEAKVSETFLQTTPQEMISYFLGKSGVSLSSLSVQTYPERPRVIIRALNVIQAIEEVHAVWGIKQPFFFSDGVFHWGTKPAQNKVYRFEYGQNILSLQRSGGRWCLETVSAPFVHHSHKIEVDHPDSSGTFEVSKVLFTTNEDGFIRTYIYY